MTRHGNRGQRRVSARGELKVIEADDRQVAGDSNAATATFEQDAKGEIVIATKHGPQVGTAGTQGTEKLASLLHRRGYRARFHQGLVIKSGFLHRVGIAGEPGTRARIEARRNRADAPVAELE